jgi:hypothetical protein
VPIIEKLLALGEVKIYELVQKVAEHNVYPWSSEPLLALYQKQFVAQAALCELHYLWAVEGKRTLVLTPVSVFAQACTGDSQSAALCEIERTPNFAFYLNTDNFYSATSESVAHLLDGFWKRYDGHVNRLPALNVLNLPEGSSWSTIHARFRELASQHHPDKGGDAAVFVDIRMAFESLRRAKAD